MKKFILIFMCALLVFLMCINAFAFNNGGDLLIEVNKKALPEGTVAIDLLVDFSDQKYNKNNKFFSEMNGSKMLCIDGTTVEVNPDSEIVRYADDEEFYSYTFHYREATTPEYDCNEYYHPDTILVRFEDRKILREIFFNVKIAYLDKEGNILTVTNAAYIDDPGVIRFFDLLEANRGNLSVKYDISPWGLVFVGFAALGFVTFYSIPVFFIVRDIRKKRMEKNKKI